MTRLTLKLLRLREVELAKFSRLTILSVTWVNEQNASRILHFARSLGELRALTDLSLSTSRLPFFDLPAQLVPCELPELRCLHLGGQVDLPIVWNVPMLTTLSAQSTGGMLAQFADCHHLTALTLAGVHFNDKALLCSKLKANAWPLLERIQILSLVPDLLPAVVDRSHSLTRFVFRAEHLEGDDLVWFLFLHSALTHLDIGAAESELTYNRRMCNRTIGDDDSIECPSLRSVRLGFTDPNMFSYLGRFPKLETVEFVLRPTLLVTELSIRDLFIACPALTDLRLQLHERADVRVTDEDFSKIDSSKLRSLFVDSVPQSMIASTLQRNSFVSFLRSCTSLASLHLRFSVNEHKTKAAARALGNDFVSTVSQPQHRLKQLQSLSIKGSDDGAPRASHQPPPTFAVVTSVELIKALLTLDSLRFIDIDSDAGYGKLVVCMVRTTQRGEC